MLYLLDRFDLELLELPERKEYMRFDFWEITEEKARRMIENERCRSIFNRKEIINLFKTGKIQMVPITKIYLNRYDRIIIWTKNGRYFVLEVTLFYGVVADPQVDPDLKPYVTQRTAPFLPDQTGGYPVEPDRHPDRYGQKPASSDGPFVPQAGDSPVPQDGNGEGENDLLNIH